MMPCRKNKYKDAARKEIHEKINKEVDMFDTDELKEFYVLNEAKKRKLKSEIENYKELVEALKEEMELLKNDIEKMKIQHREEINNIMKSQNAFYRR